MAKRLKGAKPTGGIKIQDLPREKAKELQEACRKLQVARAGDGSPQADACVQEAMKNLTEMMSCFKLSTRDPVDIIKEFEQIPGYERDEQGV